MGIENRFLLRTRSNWFNPSTSFAFMLHDSFIDAVCASRNNDVGLSGEAVGENNNKGAEGAITTESDGLKRQKRSKERLNFIKNTAEGAACNVCSSVLSCKGGNTGNMPKYMSVL